MSVNPKSRAVSFHANDQTTSATVAGPIPTFAKMMSDDEDNEVRENEAGERLVGRGLRARDFNPEDPQWYLANSDHPYAPFPDNALKWESFVYDDGTTYEGLTQVNVPHNKGVMVFGSGTGAGIQSVKPFDKYEGEFFYGFANGLGSYTSTAGETYRGEWSYGKRSGCGASVNIAPYFQQLQNGVKPEEAWQEAKKTILKDRMKYGLWEGDVLVQDSTKAKEATCSMSEIREILQEMESVVTRARMFKHKPDGDVTFMKLKDKNGTPVPVFQDPMHYPHGTKFLAPGPIGQCHPVPEDKILRSEMRKHARNYMRIYNQHNLPYFPKPGDDLFAAMRLDTMQRMGAEYYARVMNGEDEEAAKKAVEEAYLKPKSGKADLPSASTASKPRHEPQRKPAAPTPRPPPPPSSQTKAAEERVVDDEEEEDIDEDDLVASTSYLDGDGRPDGPSSGQPPSVFCHLGERSKQMTSFVQVSATRAYKRVLPRLMRRKPLGQG